MEAAKTVRMYVNNEVPAVVKDAKENYQTGFVALFRSIRSHWIWEDAEKLKWWIDILLEVNHTGRKVLIDGILIECSRGQSINSLQTWGKRWRVDKSVVRRFFVLLESDGMISRENVSKTTRLTVCNYDSYNTPRNDDETMTKRRRNDDETMTTPNNNGNNDNNVNNDNKSIGAKAPAPKFIKPDIITVQRYFTEQGAVHWDYEKFFDYYTSNGWKVGRNPMKDWKAAARNWINKSKTYQNGTTTAKRPNQKTAGAERLAAEIRTELGFASNGE